jgi:soluble lytic murein transglycosylase
MAAVSERFGEARRLHENGDYAAARNLYAAIVQEAPASAEAQEARWRLGQAYWEDGQPTEAYVALGLAQQQAPADSLPPEVDFWIGEALAEIGNPTAAVEAYRRYLARDERLAGVVNLRIGRQLKQASDPQTALDAFTQAVAAAPDNFVRFAAQEELAEIYEEQGNTQAALEQFDAILGVSQYGRYRAEIQFRSGQLLEQAGQPEAAADRYRRAIGEDSASPDALNAANALAALGQALDDQATARILLSNGYYADGIAAMVRYFDATPDHPAEPHVPVAEAYMSQREYAAALAEWQKLLDTHPEYTDRAGVLIRMAVAQARLDDPAAARDLFKQAAAASAAKAPAALLEAARLAERESDCAVAAAEYLDVARLYPAATEAGEALYRGGLCQYRLGQSAGALESWQRLVDGYAANLYAHAGRFWAGKAALELGNGPQAVALWTPLAAEVGDSYYTARAADLAAQAGLTLAGTAVLSPTLTTAPGDDGSQAAAERWLAGWAAPGQADPTSLRQLPAAVTADPQVQRVAAYLAAGLRAEALREANDVRDRYTDDPLATYALGLHWRDLGLYQHATQAAVRLAALAPPGGVPLFVERMAYPTYFADLVDAEAAGRGLDPHLIYALIRQESFFERGARSSAAAQGLTQVIPSTAEYIARAIDWPNFQPDDIYKPYVNVKFGTYYLWAALDMFDGDAYPALVAYNAGPGNAQFWYDQANTADDDLFVEEITIAEPKIYVRRVLANYAAYKRLYGP